MKMDGKKIILLSGCISTFVLYLQLKRNGTENSGNGMGNGAGNESRLGLKTVGINPILFRSDFYILPARFRIFGQIRNQYERDVKFEKGSKTV